MLVNLGDKPLADFNQPLQMLEDCHRRIEYFLDAIRRVEQRSVDGQLDDEGRQTVKASLQYLTHSAPHHTADEEDSLFPRLRQLGSWEARDVMAELDRLEQDHREAEVNHATVEKLGRHWLAQGRLDEDDRVALRSALSELSLLYEEHIDLEENRVFVLAAQLLESGQLDEIGQEMQARRRAVAAHPR